MLLDDTDRWHSGTPAGSQPFEPPGADFFSEWRRQLACTPFGRATRSTVAVGIALAREAERLGCDFVRPGQLKLSEACGNSQVTVSRALKKLSEARLVVREHRGNKWRMQADTWRLCLRAPHPGYDEHPILAVGWLWSNDYLGGTSLKVMTALVAHGAVGATAQQLADFTNLKPRNVRRHAARLDLFGLAVHPARTRRTYAEQWPWHEMENVILPYIRYWFDTHGGGTVRQEKRKRRHNALRARARTRWRELEGYPTGPSRLRS